MRYRLTTFLIFSLTQLITTSTSTASEVVCLQAPSRTSACPNLIYRSVSRFPDKKNMLFCFCKTDFKRLLNKSATETEKAFNTMEWQQILMETGYSDKQLKELINQ